MFHHSLHPYLINCQIRIGRTGRGKNSGMATTMINNKVDMAVLADLKHLLIEAKQKLPPFLASIQTEADQLNEDLGKTTNRKPVLSCILSGIKFIALSYYI